MTATNQQYAAQLAARDTSDKYTSSVCQTLVPLMKQREVQSGSSECNDTGCQANRWDIADSYAALEKGKKDEAEEQLGSVLPSGQAIATGEQRSQSASLCISNAPESVELGHVARKLCSACLAPGSSCSALTHPPPMHPCVTQQLQQRYSDLLLLQVLSIVGTSHHLRPASCAAANKTGAGLAI